MDRAVGLVLGACHCSHNTLRSISFSLVLTLILNGIDDGASCEPLQENVLPSGAGFLFVRSFRMQQLGADSLGTADDGSRNFAFFPLAFRLVLFT